MNKLEYETGMDELESIVRSLEKGTLKLEESFAAYERGAKLAAELDKLLKQGEARITALRKQAEAYEEEDISGEVQP